MGGDEFVIVMPEFRHIRDVDRCAEQIIRSASHPVEIGGRKITLSLSIGISVFPENGCTAEDLLRHADAAMYTVKDSGRNSFRIFDESLEIKRTSAGLIAEYNDASTHEQAQAEIYH